MNDRWERDVSAGQSAQEQSDEDSDQQELLRTHRAALQRKADHLSAKLKASRSAPPAQEDSPELDDTDREDLLQ